MNKKSSIRFPASCSDNLKSKACPEPRRRIENPKWMGIFVSALIFAFGGAVAEAQQPKKVPRIGYLSAVDAASESSRAEGVRARSARAWLHRRKEYRHRVPICGGEARSIP